MPGIRAFQKEWLAKAFAPDIDLAAIIGRKRLREEHLGRLDSINCDHRRQGQLHEPGGAVLVIARRHNGPGKRNFVGRAEVFWKAETIFRWRDSASGIGVRHVPTASECKILAASSKSRCWVLALTPARDCLR